MNEQIEENVVPTELSELPDTDIPKKRLLIIGLVGLLAIGVASAYYIYVQQDPVPVETAQENPFREERPWNPEGSIFLTLAPKNMQNAGIYEYKIKENTLTPYLVPEKGVVMTGKFWKGINDGMIASAYVKENLQIFTMYKDTATQLTDTDTKLKRHPVWSAPYTSLVYNGKLDGTELTLEPNSYDVYIQGKDNVEKKLSYGAFPALTPEGTEVVVLRNDGLYKIGLRASTTEKIWGYEGDTIGSAQHQFTISPNGKYIAWTHQASEKIYIMEVTSWAPFQGHIKYSVDTTAFWPVFSPNEEFLAFEEVDWIDPPQKPRLVIVDLMSMERQEVQSLDAYDQMHMFVTDWK